MEPRSQEQLNRHHRNAQIVMTVTFLLWIGFRASSPYRHHRHHQNFSFCPSRISCFFAIAVMTVTERLIKKGKSPSSPLDDDGDDGVMTVMTVRARMLQPD